MTEGLYILYGIPGGQNESAFNGGTQFPGHHAIIYQTRW
jgi:hypothetical protein